MKAWQETMNFALELNARVIVFQCPPGFNETPENIENFRRFFSSIQISGFILVWEPRGTWKQEMIKALCEELDLVHCVDPVENVPLYGKLNYFRLHGGQRYRHRYSEEEMRLILQRIKKQEELCTVQ